MRREGGGGRSRWIVRGEGGVGGRSRWIVRREGGVGG